MMFPSTPVKLRSFGAEGSAARRTGLANSGCTDTVRRRAIDVARHGRRDVDREHIGPEQRRDGEEIQAPGATWRSTIGRPDEPRLGARASLADPERSPLPAQARSR